MDKHINVVLASDDNYAQHVAVVTVSILKNTKFADQLHFFVLSDEKHLFKRTCKPSGVFQTDDC